MFLYLLDDVSKSLALSVYLVYYVLTTDGKAMCIVSLSFFKYLKSRVNIINVSNVAVLSVRVFKSSWSLGGNS